MEMDVAGELKVRYEPTRWICSVRIKKSGTRLDFAVCDARCLQSTQVGDERKKAAKERGEVMGSSGEAFAVLGQVPLNPKP
eukprot:3941971-Rhodomonas_salina.1